MQIQLLAASICSSGASLKNLFFHKASVGPCTVHITNYEIHHTPTVLLTFFYSRCFFCSQTSNSLSVHKSKCLLCNKPDVVAREVEKQRHTKRHHHRLNNANVGLNSKARTHSGGVSVHTLKETQIVTVHFYYWPYPTHNAAGKSNRDVLYRMPMVLCAHTFGFRS